MRHQYLIVPFAAMLAACSGDVSEDGDGAVPTTADSVIAENDDVPAEAGIVELPYGMTSYPGATDFSRWDTSNKGKVGAQLSMFTNDDPMTVAQYYADQSRELGMDVTGPSEQFESLVVSANRPDGKTAHYSVFERKGDRTRIDLGFASLEDQ